MKFNHEENQVFRKSDRHVQQVARVGSQDGGYLSGVGYQSQHVLILDEAVFGCGQPAAEAPQ